MMNKKGQALVEFIIILPITLVLIFCIVDFGRVIDTKSTLESKTSDIVTFYQNGKSLEEIKNKIDTKDVEIKLENNGDYITIILSKKIKPITPGLTNILDKVFDIEVTRVIRNE